MKKGFTIWNLPTINIYKMITTSNKYIVEF